MKSRGFTLIELLVVIAIIAILAAILFPIFTAAKVRAHETRCASNMSQIGKAVQMYADVWDGMYPANRLHYTAAPVDPSWKNLIRPYLPGTSIYVCPSNIAYWKPRAGVSPMDQTREFPISYAYNGLIFHEHWTDNWDNQTRKMSTIRDPRRSIYILETRSYFADLGPWILAYGDDPACQYDAAAGLGYIHVHASKRANWLFCDLHAASLTVPQTCVPSNLWGTSSIPPGRPEECAHQSFYDRMVNSKCLAPEYF